MKSNSPPCPLPLLTVIKEALQTAQCRYCQKAEPVAHESFRGHFCKACSQTLKVRSPLPLSRRGDVTLYAATTFNSAVRSLLYRYKFHHQTENRILLSDILIDYWKNKLHRTQADGFKAPVNYCVTGIPARSSGSRHLEPLAKRFAAYFGYPYCSDLLVWERETHPQHTLHHRQERLLNMKDCFRVHGDRLADRGRLKSLILPPKMKPWRIIVLDDITTTGATLREAVTALLGMGSASPASLSVIGLALTELPLSSRLPASPEGLSEERSPYA